MILKGPKGFYKALPYKGHYKALKGPHKAVENEQAAQRQDCSGPVSHQLGSVDECARIKQCEQAAQRLGGTHLVSHELGSEAESLKTEHVLNQEWQAEQPSSSCHPQGKGKADEQTLTCGDKSEMMIMMMMMMMMSVMVMMMMMMMM